MTGVIQIPCSIQIQFFSQNQSLLSLNPNQIIIKRVIQEYKRGEENEDKNNLDAASTTPKVMVTTEWQAVCMDDMDNSYDGKFIPIFNYWTTASAPLIYSFIISLLSPTNKDAFRKKRSCHLTNKFQREWWWWWWWWFMGADQRWVLVPCYLSMNPFPLLSFLFWYFTSLFLVVLTYIYI